MSTYAMNAVMEVAGSLDPDHQDRLTFGDIRSVAAGVTQKTLVIDIYNELSARIAAREEVLS